MTRNMFDVLQVYLNAMWIQINHHKDGSGGRKVFQELNGGKIGIPFALSKQA